MAGPDAKAAYQALLKVIIRPPRATYDEKRLGLSDFSVLRSGACTARTLSCGTTAGSRSGRRSGRPLLRRTHHRRASSMRTATRAID